jgi:hypothetical protein
MRPRLFFFLVNLDSRLLYASAASDSKTPDRRLLLVWEFLMVGNYGPLGVHHS